MASHGVPRISEAVPKSDDARSKELQKIVEYRALVDLVNLKIQERQYTTEVLQLTSKLLTRNPEYYTIWNRRRLILQHQFVYTSPHGPSTTEGSEEAAEEVATSSAKHERITDIIANDLQFLVPLLLKFPKCYWIWNHRLWLLEQSTKLLPVPQARQFWQDELGLVGKMLSRDSRNFHGWGYRRTVVAALESKELNSNPEGQSMVQAEFDYTTRMIKTNMSNFSAWHTRSKLIPRLLDEKGAGEEERRQFLDSELKWIQEALWTDPYNQSLWFYHHNLMCTFDPKLASTTMAPDLENEQRLMYISKEMENILELLEDAKDCKWVYQSLVQLVTTYESLSGRRPPEAEDMDTWMVELRKLDPLRNGRWKDLIEDLRI